LQKLNFVANPTELLGGGGGYQSVSDFVFFRSLYTRFCGYMQQQGAASLAEDLAPPVAAPDPLAEPPWVETPESIAQVVRILQARAEKLVVGPKGRYRGSESREEELHEHLFYSQVPKEGGTGYRYCTVGYNQCWEIRDILVRIRPSD
jgi:hypothetical protein